MLYPPYPPPPPPPPPPVAMIKGGFPNPKSPLTFLFLSMAYGVIIAISILILIMGD